MYVCVCNNVKASELRDNPELINRVGTNCGLCMVVCAQCGELDCEHQLDLALLREVSYLKLEGVL